MFVRPPVVLTLLSALALAKGSLHVGREDAMSTNGPNIVQTKSSTTDGTKAPSATTGMAKPNGPHINLSAGDWTVLHSIRLPNADDTWSITGGPTSNSEFFLRNAISEGAPEGTPQGPHKKLHFNAYIYKAEDEAENNQKGWNKYQADHFKGVLRGDTQLSADEMFECTISTEPDADITGQMVFNTTEPFLFKDGKTHGIMDYGCKKLDKVDKQEYAASSKRD